MVSALSDLDKYLSFKDSVEMKYSSNLYSYIQIMNNVQGETINDIFTKRYLEKDPNGIYSTSMVLARINNNFPVEQLLVNKQFDSIGTRYDIMEAYFKQNQTAKIPLKYRKADEFARLCIYQFISAYEDGEYGVPEKISLLGQINKEGSVYYVFKFNMPEKEEKTEMIGIAKPNKSGSIKLNFDVDNAYTSYEKLKTNWHVQANELINKLKKQTIKSAN